MDEPSSIDFNEALAEQEQSTMEVDEPNKVIEEKTSDESAAKPANAGEEDGVAPEAMEIHDIDESVGGEGGTEQDDLDKSVAPSEKSMDVTLLNSSATDPFDSVKNTSISGDKVQQKPDDKPSDDNTSDGKEKEKDDSDAAEDSDLPKLPEPEEDAGPAELDRDAATPDLEDLDEPEAANQTDDNTRDNSPATFNDDDAPAEGK